MAGVVITGAVIAGLVIGPAIHAFVPRRERSEPRRTLPPSATQRRDAVGNIRACTNARVSWSVLRGPFGAPQDEGYGLAWASVGYNISRAIKSVNVEGTKPGMSKDAEQTT